MRFEFDVFFWRFLHKNGLVLAPGAMELLPEIERQDSHVTQLAQLGAGTGSWPVPGSSRLPLWNHISGDKLINLIT